MENGNGGGYQMGIDPNTLLATLGKQGGIDPSILALMKDNNNGDDKTLWFLLLILMLGRDGLGQGGGRTGNCSTQADLAAAQNAITERTLDITRDQGANALRNETGQAALNRQIDWASAQNLSGQKDLVQQICDCCCKLGISIKDVERQISESCCETRNAINVSGLQTVNAIDKCCCETQNSIAQQTNALGNITRDEGNQTRALINQQAYDRLQEQLTDCKLNLSNQQQTTFLTEQIRQACCQPCRPCHPHPWPNGNGGNGNGPIPA